MQHQPVSFDQFFRSLQILHAAMLMGMVVVLVMLKFVLGSQTVVGSDSLFIIMGMGLALFGLLMAYILPVKKINAIEQGKLSVTERLEKYREAFVLKMALIEGPALVCIILHYLQSDSLLFYTAIFLIIVFALSRPVAEKIKEELDLRPSDIF